MYIVLIQDIIQHKIVKIYLYMWSVISLSYIHLIIMVYNSIFNISVYFIQYIIVYKLYDLNYY